MPCLKPFLTLQAREAAVLAAAAASAAGTAAAAAGTAEEERAAAPQAATASVRVYFACTHDDSNQKCGRAPKYGLKYDGPRGAWYAPAGTPLAPV